MTNKPTNPNGSNQYSLDPRQRICWEYYINPKSSTFGNGMQSAIKAGYEPTYANQITTIDWFKDKVRRLTLLSKGEKVLEETLDYQPVDDNGKVDSSLARVRLDAAKHVTSTLGKDEGYSTRTEQTGKDGGAIEVVDKTQGQELASKFEEELKKTL